MTIGVIIKNAFKDVPYTVVPLETEYVKPDITSVTESCDKELKALFPFKTPEKYEVVDIEMIFKKINATSNLSEQINNDLI